MWLIAKKVPLAFSTPTPSEYCSPNEGALVWNRSSGSNPTLVSERLKPIPSSNWAPFATRSGFADLTELAMLSKFDVLAG